MIRVILAAGVAAMALSAPAASAQPDRGNRDSAERSDRQKAQKARSADRREARTERAARTERRAQRAERTERRAQRVERRAERVQAAPRQERMERREARVQQREERIDRRQAREQRVQRVEPARAERIERRQRLAAERVNARERQLERIANRDDRRAIRLDARREQQLERIADRQDRRLARLAETRVVRLNEWDDLVRGGVWLNGCPPGLAKKPVACVPPGQVKNLVGQPVNALADRVVLQSVPDRLRLIYPDTDDYYYRYGNGYMYRVNRSNDLISALLPLFGLGLTVGQPFPTAYSNYYLPTGLMPFYPTYSSQDYYRYANGYVYEIDGRTGLIEDVDPMLGFGYGYGQMMPLTYSAYNVPYQYRPLYYDTSDYYYRYAPGAIYQVDPTTSLITAVAALLTGGLTVGQPMPLGYSTYNVPFAYRQTYFDTPDHMYRYSNGYIYQVDPRTLLVTAIVASALT